MRTAEHPTTTEQFPIPPEDPGRRGLRTALMVAIAVAAVAAGVALTTVDDGRDGPTTAVTVVAQPDAPAGTAPATTALESEPVVASTVPKPATTMTTTPASPDRPPPARVTYRPQAVWPDTTNELDLVQGAVDQGLQPWRTDPVEVTRAYLVARGLPTPGLGPFVASSGEGGSVQYTVGGRAGRVDLRRLTSGSIWYVTQSSSATVPGLQVERRGASLAVTVQSGVAGTMAVRAKRPGGDWGPAETREMAPGARRSVTVAADQGDAILQVRFADPPGLAETFIGEGTAAVRSSALDAESPLRVDGIGPVRIGMPLQEAQAAAGLPMSYTEAGVCAGFRTWEPPVGLSFDAVEGSGRVDFVSVSEPSIATVSGIRVGASLADVRRTYGDRLTGSVQHGWGRLVFRADDPALDRFAMAFLFTEDRVHTILSGLRTVVERDEICA